MYVIQKIAGLQMTKVTFNAALVERSAIAKSLIEVRKCTHMHACTDPYIMFVFHLQTFYKCQEHSTRCVLLQTIQMLSETPTNCNHMLSVGGAQLICDAFTLPDPEQR